MRSSILQTSGTSISADQLESTSPGRQTPLTSTHRHDFYQTGRSVIASLYLKKVDKASSTITFNSSNSIDVNLHTTDNKVYHQTIPLYASIDTEKSTYKILGTKVEFELIKADGTNWAVLKSGDRPTGEIIQTGRAARV